MLFIGWTTVAKREEAETLAKGLVSNRLAACVQIEGPIISHYLWQEKEERSEEFRLTVKFLPARSVAVKEWLLVHHPYETPEWIVIQADFVGEKYLSWAQANSTDQPL